MFITCLPFLLQDLTLKNGVTIPAGTVVVVPIQLVQMDNCSWGIDASQFNPYRFLSKKGRQCDQLGNISSMGFNQYIFRIS